jgi:MYXO-CTERM domain-containing protein
MVSRDGQLIAATDTGVFTAAMGSTSWSRLGAGLPAVQVRDVWLDPSGRYLLVSAYGRGVWMLDFASNAPGSNGPAVNPATAPSAVTVGLPNTRAAGGAPLAAQVGAVLLVLAALVGMRRRRRSV